MSSSQVRSQSNTQHHAILLAEPQFLIGLFKVRLSQIVPHPHQRCLSEDWVEKLHIQFLELGIDRASHPIKVLLKEMPGAGVMLSEDSHPGSSEGVPELASSLACLVYHGQHRVAACRAIEDVGEHWWYAEVYNPGESFFLAAWISGSQTY